MPIHKFNLEEMFQKQFGYKPLDIPIEEKNLIKKSEPGKYGSYYAKDLMGRTVFMPVTLGGLFLPYVWINVSSSKRIVETPLTERRGTVKEQIAIEDYKFGVKGFIIGHDGKFPEKDVEALKTLWERNESLPIKCVFTDIFLLTTEHGGTDKVVMTDFNIYENQGIEHVRGFDFSLKSDQDFELILE